VIVVDWSGGSGPPYPQAVANIRLVGVMTAHLIKNLIVSTINFFSHTLLVCLCTDTGLNKSNLTTA